MGSERIGFFLVFFICLCNLLSSSSTTPIHRPLLSDSLQEQTYGVGGTTQNEVNGGVEDVDWNGISGIKHSSSKYAHGIAGGAAGGGATVVVGHGHGGGSSGTPDNGNNGAQGGGAAAVNPIVAGAANNNHHQNIHRGAASCKRNSIGLPALISTLLVSPFIHFHAGF